MDELHELVIQAQSGDLDAYRTIVRQYRAWAVWEANRILRGRQCERAEDAVQAAFIEAYYCLEKLRDPLAFKSWFRKIIVKQCDRIIRKQRGEFLPLEAVTELPSSEPEPAQGVVRQELQAELTVAFASLPDGVSEVATRFYLNGESQKEISAATGLAVKTVKNYVYDARQRLRENPVLKASLEYFNVVRR